MLGCVLVEAVPPIASSVFGRLLDANKGVRSRVLDIAEEDMEGLLSTNFKGAVYGIQRAGRIAL